MSAIISLPDKRLSLSDYSPKPGKLAKGEWNEGVLALAHDFSWNISDKVKAPGVYAITFPWKSGQSSLTVESVALVINGETIHTDDHPAWSGIEN